MKIPEPLFIFINPIVRLLLKSWIHFFWSGNLMLITFTGRKSGRRFTTPVRYIRDAEPVRCFTSAENQWWRNLRGEANVVLRIAGHDASYQAIAVDNDPVEVKKWLQYYLGLFPQDSAYHDIHVNNDKSLVAADLEKASRNTILVEARPIPD